MKHLLIITALAAMLAGCVKSPEQKASTTNPELPVGKMFEYDGCKVYRFMDGGYYRYFTKCEGAGQSTTTSHYSCGKNCSHADDIPTN